MKKEDVLKGIEAMDGLFTEGLKMSKSAIRFIANKDMWEEFMKFYMDEEMKEIMDENTK